MVDPPTPGVVSVHDTVPLPLQSKVQTLHRCRRPHALHLSQSMPAKPPVLHSSPSLTPCYIQRSHPPSPASHDPIRASAAVMPSSAVEPELSVSFTAPPPQIPSHSAVPAAPAHTVGIEPRSILCRRSSKRQALPPSILTDHAAPFCSGPRLHEPKPRPVLLCRRRHLQYQAASTSSSWVIDTASLLSPIDQLGLPPAERRPEKERRKERRNKKKKKR
ncbi:hypothetical protein M0R45_016595 [Rubus argutus]|uniref:Uncharacterized protein n=1 Tax=Rubus argutus TaxID=59490 RepID=A0AAW1XVH3_RUBAR